MVTINLAYTAPINPAGASPTLTPTQIWRGLERKVRAAQEFVPLITSCTVLSETTPEKTGNFTITREVVFKSQPDQPVREECVHYAPSRVDFAQADGSTISNVVSRDGQGELWMTYVFEWRHPGVEEEGNEKKVEELREGHWKTAKMAVEGSINTIRRLVKEGEIQ
ncbi:hypothetical protein PG993_004379 [Apiospora rasikravindrae]|uniref:DUF1857-domain-containing protein n=1 Tax=Apiospora rasikravindrae TaxID=990691 RepID=A0ABR1TCK3_9PEZI